MSQPEFIEPDEYEDCHRCGFVGPDVFDHLCIDCEQFEQNDNPEPQQGANPQ